MSASRQQDPQGPHVPDQGRSVEPCRADASTPQLQYQINEGEDLGKIAPQKLKDLIAALTKDPSTIRRIRRDIEEQQGEMDLHGQLSSEESFRENIEAQIEYAKMLKALGERKDISGTQRLGRAIGELIGFMNESRRNEVGLRLAEGARVRAMRDQAEDMGDQVEQLTTDLRRHKARSAQLLDELATRPPAPEGGVEGLRAQLAGLTDDLGRLATELNERMVNLLLETEIAAEGHPAAFEERINLFTPLVRELASVKRRMFDPSLEACWELIQRLKTTGHDTAVYEESLESGNVGAILATERLLRVVVERVEKVHGAVDPRLLMTLSELEAEVAQRVTDARLRVVPIGLVRFCRELLSDPIDPTELAARVRTVEKIKELVRQYIG